MLKFFSKCPGCGGGLIITECRCVNCGLQMRGEFQPPQQFATLSDEQLTFIRIFLRARGNLTEVEKILGVSYPTIRNKLDEINQTLDNEQAAVSTARESGTAAEEPNPGADERRAILEQVSAGKISAVEAVDRLRNLQGGK